MPTPSKGEKRKDFVERCIPIVINDGTATDGSQAYAVCQSKYDEAKLAEEKQLIERINNAKCKTKKTE